MEKDLRELSEGEGVYCVQAEGYRGSDWQRQSSQKLLLAGRQSLLTRVKLTMRKMKTFIKAKISLHCLLLFDFAEKDENLHKAEDIVALFAFV